MKIAGRAERIRPFHVMELLARAKALEAEGRNVVHMEVGEPDFPTPETVIAAAARELSRGRIHYTPALGLPQLREAIADYYKDRFGLDVDPGRIVVTPGSSTGLQLVMSALVDKGEEVLLTDPGYPCNRNFVHLVDAKPVGIAVDAASRYQPTPDRVAAAWSRRTRALVVATPANPTGSLLDLESLAALYEPVAAAGAWLIVDEIYQGLTYGAEDVTALALEAENLIVVNSFSKYFGMTGWRVGWLVVPHELVPTMEKLAQNLYLSAPTLAQHAAIEALGPGTRPVLDARRDEFRKRRDYLYGALGRIGFGVGAIPEGAFYVYADCSPFTADSYRFAWDLLEQTGVAVTPGRDFGAHESERHLRFAYTTQIDRLEEGISRIEAFLAQRRSDS